jgi:adenylate cyclase
MASFFRSISIKIFGVAVGLLILLAGAALYSAMLTEDVHRQLRTLNHSLFPLTITLTELRTTTQGQQIRAEVKIDGSLRKAETECRSSAAAYDRKTKLLGDKAEELRSLGARIAVLERNKIQMARLQPMIAELQYQNQRLARRIIESCAPDAPPGQSTEVSNQAKEVARLANTITSEVALFVSQGAIIVGDNQTRAMRANLILIGAAGFVGLMLAWLVARGLTRPIIRLQAGARAVAQGLLDQAEVPVTSADEIGDVTHAFNNMVVDLREKERIKDTFGQYVDPRVVAALIGGGQYSSEGEKRVATLFFSDMIGFTSISERLAPSTLVDLINAYFTEMSAPIRDSSGIIDKYIGDAIMAFWVPPFVDPNEQARLACAAALEQRARLEAFRIKVPDLIGLRRDVPLIDFRVALASGEVVVGSIGSESARSFTVMGDTVNFASRLEGANKAYGTRLLIDGTTHDMAGEAIETREIDLIGVVGRDEPVRVYELAALAGALPPDKRQLFDLYAEGLAHYRAASWAKADAALREALSFVPDDGPSTTLLRRIERFRETAPADWNGIWRMTEK